jgi:hypothetical protein
VITAAGWYDEQGRQLLVAETGTARACFYIGEAVGLLSDWAVSPSGPSDVRRPQWSPIRAVFSVPVPDPVRSYGDSWQVEAMGSPGDPAQLSFKLDGQQHNIDLPALPPPVAAGVAYSVVDTFWFRNTPAQLLSVSVNATYDSGGIELPRALQFADYYSVDDRSGTYLWAVDEGRYLRAYSRATHEELSAGTGVDDSFKLFIAGHLF